MAPIQSKCSVEPRSILIVCCKGLKTGDFQVQGPIKLELSVNLKIARRHSD